MLASAFRLQARRLAHHHQRSVCPFHRSESVAFSTSRLLRRPSEEQDGPNKDHDPPRSRVTGRRRPLATARVKTGIPDPPALPQWFFERHVREPAVTGTTPHFMASWDGAQTLHAVRAGTELNIPHFPVDTYRREFTRLFSPLVADRNCSKAQGADVRDKNVPEQGRLDEGLEKQAKRSCDDHPTGDDSVVVDVSKNEDENGLGQTIVAAVNQLGRLGERKDVAALHSTRDCSDNRLDSIHEAIAKEFDGQPFKDLDRVLFHAHLLLSSIFTASPDRSVPEMKSLRNNLMLTATESETYYKLPSLVHDLADMAGARLIDLDASTIADLAGEYIDGPLRGPGTVSDLAYDAYEGFTSDHGNEVAASDEDAEGDTTEDFLGRAKNMLGDVMNSIKLILDPEPISAKEEADDHVPNLTRWQGLKLEAFWDHLLVHRPQPQSAHGMPLKGDFTRAQQPTTLTAEVEGLQGSAYLDQDVSSPPNAFDRSGAQQLDRERLRRCSRKTTTRLQLAQYMSQTQPSARISAPFEGAAPIPPVSDFTGPKTVVHIRDLDIVMETPQGDVILQCLLKSIQKRRQAGEAIVVVGTTAEFNNREQLEPSGFLRLHVPGAVDEDFPSIASAVDRASTMGNVSSEIDAEDSSANVKAERRVTHINLRNIQSHARYLKFDSSARVFNAFERPALSLLDARLLKEAVLSREQVHEIVLFANAFCKLYTTDKEMGSSHIVFAANFLAPNFGPQYTQSDGRSKAKSKGEEEKLAARAELPSPPKPATPKPRRINMTDLQRMCSVHEKRLLPGLREPSKIKTTFEHVHAPASTIDTLKTITGLSLVRPDAFSYGVLAESRLSGLLLYGPPGTGKTMLAKAVAKDAACAVLEVSGAQIYDKYVGEGEKMVRAVFSLGKKLSPCIVFIDEADALFSSRSTDRQRTTHREIITQFLAEWDGMAEHNVFVMVATNRPFELDDAVLRRLPRRVLVDLPTVADRESILRIHLRGEQVDKDVSIGELARQTLFFSGSDLRNLCVAAAFAAVKAENALALEHKDDRDFKLPEKRTLNKAHFAVAMLEIGASISEDMDSLKAIKKFDDKFGEGRDKRRKKAGEFGFGEANEQAQADTGARVRGPT